MEYRKIGFHIHQAIAVTKTTRETRPIPEANLDGVLVESAQSCLVKSIRNGPSKCLFAVDFRANTSKKILDCHEPCCNDVIFMTITV